MLGGGKYEYGYHFLIGLRPATVLHDEDKRLLEDLRPAGVVLFGANFARDRTYEEWLETHARLIEGVRTHCGRDNVLICVDHEGSGIVRPPEPITAYARAREWAAASAAVGRAMGVELSSLGINVNFAPVLDIDSEPRNPIIGTRAFGTTPAAVMAAAERFIESMQAEGVLACPKHYPGHGAAIEDSHETLPVVDIGVDVLQQRELLPFAAVVRGGIHMLMSAHLSFPRIDRDPATYSSVLLRDILRGELGFEGVLVTDDVGMPAMGGRFLDDDALDRALDAGTDLIMVCDYWTSTERVRGLAERIAQSRASGRLSAATLAESRRRIARLLSLAPANAVTQLPPEVLDHHRSVAPLGRRSSAVLSESQTVRARSGRDT